MTTFQYTVCLVVTLVLMACQPLVQSDDPASTPPEDVESSDVYDADLAAAYGADDYGMRKYVMAFLRRGPNRDQIDSTTASKLQSAHLENITRMAEEGTLVLAGPFIGGGDLRGIYVFAVESIEEAEALTNTDPAIQAGSLSMELVEWYGAAALMALNEIHPKVTKKSVF